MDITPEVQELIDAKIAEARTSFEEEKDKIVNNSKKLLNEKKNLEDRLSQFDGVDPEEFKKMQKILKDQEDKDILENGGIEELVNKKVQLYKSELEGTLFEKDTTIEDLKAQRDNLQNKYNQKIINDELRNAAASSRILDSAYDDVLLRASGVFSIDEDGNVVSLNSDGSLKTDKDGKPITPKSFIQGLQKSAPHLWPQSESGNLRGSGDDKTPFGRGSSADEAAKAGDMKRYRAARKKTS